MPRLRRLRIPAIAIACLIAGIAIGFVIARTSPGGTLNSSDRAKTGPGASRLTGRNVYSPDIRSDEYVRQEQLKIVEMLENQCRSTRQNCQLAEAARRSLNGD
jgi:hypothetical protein